MMKQIFLFVFMKYMYTCLTPFFDQLRITLKIARGKTFFQYSKFTQKYI